MNKFILVSFLLALSLALVFQETSAGIIQKRETEGVEDVEALITFLEQRMAELSPEEEQELTRNLSLVGLLTGSGATKAPGTGLLNNIILGLLGLKTVAR